MPELPEIETLRQDLDVLMSGRTIRSAVVSNLRSVRFHGDRVDSFSKKLSGAHIDNVGRKGKYLSFLLRGSDLQKFAMVAHMGMSGQMRCFSSTVDFPKHSHVRFEMSDGAFLVFIDPRTFGQLYVDELGDSNLANSLSRLGVDPILESSLIDEALGRFRRSQVGVKWLLLDQSRICGIGNMYADEILFRSGIRFDRPGTELNKKDLDSLSCTISEVLHEAIVARGSSLKDLQYRDVKGEIGSFQECHRAYGREGLDCLRCKGTIVRIFTKGRSSYLCTDCQM